jgi:hypothetical protein
LNRRPLGYEGEIGCDALQCPPTRYKRIGLFWLGGVGLNCRTLGRVRGEDAEKCGPLYGGIGTTLLDSRPACKEDSCMDPARFPHALHPLAPDSQGACERTH